MAKYSIEGSTLTNIADAIRAKTGSTAQITPETMDEALNSIPEQAAKTVTPSTADQTAVAKGVFTTGEVTVKGDANLEAENIADGVSIFGVVGSHKGGANIDTCSITLSEYQKESWNVGYVANCFVDGERVIKSGAAMTEPTTTITDVICGSLLIASCDDPLSIDISGGVDCIEDNIPDTFLSGAYGHSIIFIAPLDAGAHGTIVFWED